MIDDYISREAAVEKLTFLCELREIVCSPDDEFLRGLKTALNTIKSNETIPSADVQPVKHGRWENTNTPNQLRCSKCEVIHFIAQYPHGEINFCPNCGARMEGEQNG